MDETTGQAHPTTYEIQEDENSFYICCNLRRISIGYNTKLDVLILSSLAIICGIKNKSHGNIRP
jgi:hypothetical protein